MENDLRLAFSKKFFVTLLLSSALLRWFFLFIYLPDEPSEFGPDEGTYGALADYVARSLPVQDFPGFGPDLYNSARALIVPSSILVRFGLSPLDSVRFVSSLYGICSLVIFFMCAIALQRLNCTKENSEFFTIDYRLKLISTLYAFIPSYFLWSNLGLRESASQLYVILTFYLCIKLLNSRGYWRYILILVSPLSLMLAFGSRPETALVFVICALTFSLVAAWKVRNYSITFVMLAGFFLGQTFTTTPTVEAKVTLVAIRLNEAETQSPQPAQSSETKSAQPAQSSETKSAQPAQSSETKSAQPAQSSETNSSRPEINSVISAKCRFKDQILVENKGKFVCSETKQYSIIERNPIDEARIQALTAQNLEYKRNVNRLEASSALPESSCGFNFDGFLQKMSCSVVELPYRLTSFLIRPFPFIDTGSNFQNLAGIENVIWLLLICLAVLQVIRKWRNLRNRLIVAFLSSFVLCFSAAASLYEGNLGTAFRHKSTILWPLLLIFILNIKSTLPRNNNK